MPERAWAWTPPSATANAENAIVMHGKIRSPGHSLLRVCSEASGSRRGGFGATGRYVAGTAHQNTAAVRTLLHGRLMRFGRTTAVYSGDLPLVWLAGPRHTAGAAGLDPYALALMAAVAASAQSCSVDNTSTATPVETSTNQILPSVAHCRSRH